ncbi:casein kinase 2 regulatory subunit [Batrachochytrium dendrobatidis]
MYMLSQNLQGLFLKSISTNHSTIKRYFIKHINMHAGSQSDSQNEDSGTSGFSEISSSEVSWISWYCSLPEHEFFLEIPEEYLEDEFNLAGLSSSVPLYNEALDLILDLELECSDTDDSNSAKVPQQRQQYNAHLRMVESSAQILYGLIHARFLLTKPALVNMAERFRMKDFGRCPRVGCGKCGVVPCGLSDIPGVATLKMYCPRCGDLYSPKKPRFQSLDGSSFGTSFPSFLFLTMPHLVPPVRMGVETEQGYIAQMNTNEHERAALIRAREHPVLSSDENSEMSESSESESEDEQEENDRSEKDIMENDSFAMQRLPDYWVYTPKIFGFRISELSSTGPRLGWLRWRSGLPIPGKRHHNEMDNNLTTRQRPAHAGKLVAPSSGVACTAGQANYNGGSAVHPQNVNALELGQLKIPMDTNGSSWTVKSHTESKEA